MDPSRKRAIRMTVALTAALLLASALVYVSFDAGRDDVTAASCSSRRSPGSRTSSAGTVASEQHVGGALEFRVRDPKLHSSVPVRYTGIVPDPFAVGAACSSPCRSRAPALSASRLADDQVPVQVSGREREGRLMRRPRIVL